MRRNKATVNSIGNDDDPLRSCWKKPWWFHAFSLRVAQLLYTYGNMLMTLKSEFVCEETLFCGLWEFVFFVEMAKTGPRILH